MKHGRQGVIGICIYNNPQLFPRNPRFSRKAMSRSGRTANSSWVLAKPEQIACSTRSWWRRLFLAASFSVCLCLVSPSLPLLPLLSHVPVVFKLSVVVVVSSSLMKDSGIGRRSNWESMNRRVNGARFRVSACERIVFFMYTVGSRVPPEGPSKTVVKTVVSSAIGSTFGSSNLAVS